MRFGLLAADEDAMRLVAAADDLVDYQFSRAYQSQPWAAELKRRKVDVREESWEALLHAPECDAVVVGRAGPSEQRAEQLRKLVQAAVPLIVVHPVGDMMLAFELQMIQTDSHSPIVPWFAGLEHPFLHQFCPLHDPALHDSDDAAADGPTPGIEQLFFDRVMADTGSRSVMDQFARDALWIRRWAGRIDRIGAMGSQPWPDADWRNLSVHMTSREGCIVRWSSNPRDGQKSPDNAAEITLISQAERKRWQIPESIDHWQPPEPPCGPENDLAPDRWPLDALAAALSFPPNAQSDQIESRQEKDAADAPSENPARLQIDALWEDACRSIELADTLPHSYRRGKTIELYHEQHSEEETFKAMMAAVGCFAIMAAIVVLLMITALDLLNFPIFQGDGWKRWPWKALHYRAWGWYLLLGLSVFLALQFLRLVFPKDNSGQSSGQSDTNGGTNGDSHPVPPGGSRDRSAHSAETGS